jgi:hypothetical protein
VPIGRPTIAWTDALGIRQEDSAEQLFQNPGQLPPRRLAALYGALIAPESLSHAEA